MLPSEKPSDFATIEPAPIVGTGASAFVLDASQFADLIAGTVSHKVEIELDDFALVTGIDAAMRSFAAIQGSITGVTLLTYAPPEPTSN
jgi:hypothetical protein